MEKYADLHVHTNFSDGTFTPEEVVRHANSKGFACIGICDHDCVDGIDPAVECAKGTALEIIPGVELTVIKDTKEIHMLGYFISWKERWFIELLKKVQGERNARLDKMLSKLSRFNIVVDKEKVIRLAGGKGSIGRLHLARALKEVGAVSSVQAAFDIYIGDFKPCYVEDIGFGPKEAVRIILKAKGVPVLAHPSTLRNDSLVRELVKDGICGIEVYHSDHTASDSRKYEKMAKEHNLLVTGGSDCHGHAKHKVLMGEVKVPYSLVERLREKAKAITGL